MKLISTLLVGAAAAAALAGVAAPASAASTQHNCFYSTDWSNWRAPTDKIIYLKVGMRDVYRVDLAAGSSRLTWPGSHLVSIVRGSSNICSPLDLDLKVSDDSGFATPLFPQALTKLTPEEIAAIPRKFRP